MRTRVFLMLPLICAPLAFWACGDDSGTSAKYDESSNSVVEGSNSSVASITYGELLDTRDNQVYKTVTIGKQIWMAQNLNYAYNEPTSSLDSSSFCYDNSADSCAKYGRLYLWSAAMDSAAVFSDAGKGCGYDYVTTCESSGTVRGVCPEGWHLPNDDEWNTLFSTVGGNSSAGTKLKSTRGWDASGNGTDSYGFGVLPAGRRRNDGNFRNAGYNAYFWSSTERDSYLADYWEFYYVDEDVGRNLNYKCYGFSVRCLRDSNDEGSGASSSSSQAQPSSSSIKNE